MANIGEGETILHAKVSDATKEQLQMLAGGQRKVGQYLDQIVPMLFQAQAALDTAIEEAQQFVIVRTIAENSTIRVKATPEDLKDFETAREIREAVERGERETVPWEEVKAGLKEKGLLRD